VHRRAITVELVDEGDGRNVVPLGVVVAATVVIAVVTVWR
jgi:hypothetical protein